MTKEAQNIAIAEACGWTVRFNENKDLHELLTPQGKWEYPYDADGGEEHCWNYAPDYVNDLNAMHEAEKAAGLLNDDFRGRKARRTWRRIIALITKTPEHATAAERAEVFCKMFNLWRTL